MQKQYLALFISMLFWTCGVDEARDYEQEGYAAVLLLNEQLLTSSLLGDGEQMDSLLNTIDYADEASSKLYDLLRLYYTAKEQFKQMHFLEAAELTEKLREMIVARSGALPSVFAIQAFQLLAQVHAEKGAFPDSINYYTQQAALLIDEHTPQLLLVEQQFCENLSVYNDHGWKTMIHSLPAVRKDLLALGAEASVLYARILLQEAIGHKKLGDNKKSALDKQQSWQRSRALIEEAEEILLQINSPRWIMAREALVIQLAREVSTAEYATLLAPLQSREVENMRYGNVNRLRGYYHIRQCLNKAGNCMLDSVEYYYEQYLAAGPFFNEQQVDETNFSLIYVAEKRGDYNTAYAIITGQLVSNDCCLCAEESQLINLEGEGVSEQAACYLLLSRLGKSYNKRFSKFRDTVDLKLGMRLSQLALSGWEHLFSKAEEGLILEKTQEMGSRILDNAITAAYNAATTWPEESKLDTLLMTIELSKTYLLNRDLTYRQEANRVAVSPVDSLRRLQVEISLLENKYEVIGALSEAETNRLRTAKLALEKMNDQWQLQRSNWASATEQAPPTIKKLRTALGEDQGLLELIEANGVYYGLYIDVDTTILWQPGAEEGPSVNTLIATFKGILVDHKNRNEQLATYSRTAHQLYEYLIGPIAGPLSRRQSLIIAPSVHTRQIPFGALLTRAIAPNVTDWQALPYLVKGIAIRYIPSWRVESWNAAQRKPINEHSKAGVWTHPSLMKYLGGVATRLMDKSGRKSRHFVAEDCNQLSFFKHNRKFDLLHLSIHAQGNPNLLHDNYLYFNRLDSLNGVQIGLHTLPASLVVLAACSSGIGLQQTGEGTFSIQRSFHLAGVPDVLSSLWNINGNATNLVLQEFYTSLYAGAPPALALAKAQRACLQGQLGADWTWPGYWSGLVMG